MDMITLAERSSINQVQPGIIEKPFSRIEGFNSTSKIINGFERSWVELWVKITILFIALKCYRSFAKALKAARGLFTLKRTVNGRNRVMRCVKINRKYFFGMYSAAFPSKIFNRFIQTELNRVVPHNKKVNRFEIVHLAITTKCPLQCEHCFEWDNLNKPETFTNGELKKIIRSFQQPGCAQIHFTGGEPLVRMQRLEELIRFAHNSSECWILTSGQNLTLQNAHRLKNAGAIGVVISLDHYDAVHHNAFRGSGQAFDNAMHAVENANRAKLVTVFSICLTRAFITEENLVHYADLAKYCGVSFVQLLEPKTVGHYAGKDVVLSKEQTDILDRFYLKINFNRQYKNYPVFIYHGYYQRKIGCLSAGNWALYVDSAGFINACTFCHTKNYNARDIIDEKLKVDQIHMAGCPTYRK